MHLFEKIIFIFIRTCFEPVILGHFYKNHKGILHKITFCNNYLLSSRSAWTFKMENCHCWLHKVSKKDVQKDFPLSKGQGADLRICKSEQNSNGKLAGNRAIILTIRGVHITSEWLAKISKYLSVKTVNILIQHLNSIFN